MYSLWIPLKNLKLYNPVETYKVYLEQYTGTLDDAVHNLVNMAYYYGIKMSNTQAKNILNGIPCCLYYNLSLAQCEEIELKFKNRGLIVRYEIDQDPIPAEGENGVYLRTKTEKSHLGKCPKCGQTVSSQAYECPHCGHMILPRPQKSSMSTIGSTIIAVIVALFILPLF